MSVLVLTPPEESENDRRHGLFGSRVRRATDTRRGRDGHGTRTRVLWNCVRGEMGRGSESSQETARLLLRARSKRLAWTTEGNTAVTVKGAGSDWVGVPAGW